MAKNRRSTSTAQRELERQRRVWMKEAKPLLTKRHPAAIEQFLKDDVTTRTIALFFLAHKKFKMHVDAAETDRKTALSLAYIHAALARVGPRYKTLARLMDQARWRMAMAIGARDDASSVLDEGDKQYRESLRRAV